MNLSAPSLLSPEGIASLKLFFFFCYHPIEPMNTGPLVTGARPLRGSHKTPGGRCVQKRLSQRHEQYRAGHRDSIKVAPTGLPSLWRGG